MKTSESDSCQGQPTSILPTNTQAIQSPLLRLPLELRRMIYWLTIVDCRSPTPQEVHESDLRARWKDVPSPILGGSKRIRGEVFDMLQNRPFTMRVTSYGAAFDTLGLSCFIAQKHAKSYNLASTPRSPNRNVLYLGPHMEAPRRASRCTTNPEAYDLVYGKQARQMVC